MVIWLYYVAMTEAELLEKTMTEGSDRAPLAVSEICKKYRSPLRYPGGKQKAIDKIAKMLPAKAGEYREPLVGGGSVYFYAKSNDFAQNTNNQSDIDDINKVISTVSYFPRFTLLKLQFGMQF